jgi:hypothetical protein
LYDDLQSSEVVTDFGGLKVLDDGFVTKTRWELMFGSCVSILGEMRVWYAPLVGYIDYILVMM